MGFGQNHYGGTCYNMSHNLNPVVIDNSKGSSFFEKLRQQTVSNIPKGSGDILVSNNSNGSTFNINPSLIPVLTTNYDRVKESIYTLPEGTDPNTTDISSTLVNQVLSALSPSGETDCAFWDKDRAYYVGDIVRVNQTYYAGTELDANDEEQDIYVFPGTYICVSEVPPNYSDADKQIIAGMEDAELKAHIQSTYRKSGVVYAPVWKHHDNPYGGWNEEKMLGEMSTMLGGNARGRYWDLISLLPSKMKVCIDGVESSILISAVVIPTSNDGLPTI